MSELCSNQDSYNQAFKKALNKYKKDEDIKKGLRCDENDTGCKVGMIIIFIIMIIFYLWAVILALKVSDPEHRTLHVLFALATGPLYVLAYYASTLGGKDMDMDFDLDF
jgi:uncharacterized membrane protein (DUF106 family)